MARGIEIPVVADVAGAIAGITDLADAVDQVAVVFDEAGDASARTGDQIEGAGRQAEQAGERVERSWSEAMSEVRQQARDAERAIKDVGDAGDRAGRQVSDGADRGSDGLRDMGDSARESGAEIATGIGGGIDSAIDGLAEFASEAGEGFGAVGIAAGLLAAGGIALIGAEMEKTKERVNTQLDAMLENLGAFTTAAQRLAIIQQFVTDQTGEWTEAQKAQEQVGVRAGDWLAAITGDASALAAVQEQLAAHTAEAADKFAAGEITGKAYAGVIQNTDRWQGILNESIRSWNADGNTAASRFNAVAEAAEQLGVNADGTTGQLQSMKEILEDIPNEVPVSITFSQQQAQAQLDDVMSRLRRPTVAIEARFGKVAV